MGVLRGPQRTRLSGRCTSTVVRGDVTWEISFEDFMMDLNQGVERTSELQRANFRNRGDESYSVRPDFR